MVMLSYVYSGIHWMRCEVVGIYVGTDYSEVRTRELGVDDDRVTPLVQAMMEEWNSVPSGFRMIFSADATNYDGCVEWIKRDDLPSDVGKNALGYTEVGIIDSRIQYALTYITKNPAVDSAGTIHALFWTFYADPDQDDEVDYRTVLLHELGHWLKLEHEEQCANDNGVMDANISTQEIDRDLTCDEANGIRRIYGAGSESWVPPGYDCGGDSDTSQTCPLFPPFGCPKGVCGLWEGIDKADYLLSLLSGLEAVRKPGCFMDYANAIYALYQEEIDFFPCVHPDIAYEIAILAESLAIGLDIPLTPVQELGKIITAEDIRKAERIMDKAIAVVNPGLAYELKKLRPILGSLEGRRVGDVLYQAYTQPIPRDPDDLAKPVEPDHSFWFKPIAFKGHVEFVLNIPEKTDVRFTIYDEIGRRVKDYWRGAATVYPGEYHFIWDGTNNEGRLVSSGIYIYRLETISGYYQMGKFLYME